MARYYWNADEFDHSDGEDLLCRPLSFHLEVLLEDVLTHVRLYPAVMEKGTGDFYCDEFDFVGNSRMASADYHQCGRACDAYAPRNGKSGRCRYSKPVYDTAPAVLLKRDGTVVPAHPENGLYAQMMNVPGVDMGAISEAVKKDTRPIVEMLEDLIATLPDNSKERR